MSDPERPRRRVVAAPARQVRLASVRVMRDEDGDADASYLEQEGFESRLKEFKRGRLHFVRLLVEADVELADGAHAYVTSAGIGGIESDTTEEELDELIVEEWRVLRKALTTIGVSTSELPLDVDPSWVEWRT